MSCIYCYSPLVHLQNYRQNAEINTRIPCHFSGYSNSRMSRVVISQVGVFPVRLEAFPSFTLAVAKPPDTSVLIQTSALMLFVYFIANFVVPQFISKSFEFDKDDENENRNNITIDERKENATTGKRGFNSTKPK